jgi:hypothetical protein
MPLMTSGGDIKTNEKRQMWQKEINKIIKCLMHWYKYIYIYIYKSDFKDLKLA